MVYPEGEIKNNDKGIQMSHKKASLTNLCIFKYLSHI